MSTDKPPDTVHAADQKVFSQDNRKASDVSSTVRGPADPPGLTSSDLHRQIHDALETPAFKKDAAGKSGEDLKLAVAAAISSGKVLVEVVSVGLADAAEAYAATPYEAVWTTAPDAATERSFFGV